MRVIAGNGSFHFVNDANFNAHKAKVSKKKNRDARTASNTKSTEPSMPCVDIRQLVVGVYSYTRGFGLGVTDHIIQSRLGETPDPDLEKKVHSFVGAKFPQDVSYYGQVDEWLNEQFPYEELAEWTKFDDAVQRVYDEAENQLDKEYLEIKRPSGRAGEHSASTGSGS